MSSKFVIIWFICVFGSLSLANNQPDTSQSWIKRNFKILNSKFDSLNEKIEHRKVNQLTGNDAICVDNAINSTVSVNTLQQLFQTTIDTIDKKLKHVEKFEENLKKIEKFENFFKTIEDILWQLANKSQEQKEELKNDVKNQLDRVEPQLNQHKSFNVCEDNPCIYGGRCVPLSCGKDFRCTECPGYRSGEHCKKLNCVLNSNCWNSSKTLYKLLEAKVTWTEAKRKCESEDMTLIMPKEKEQTEFTAKQLRSIYGSGTGNWFWMGIVKSAGGSGWKWIDGSDLGSYTGGNSDFKSASGDQYGQLYFGGRDSMWSWDGIAYSSYLMCEKRNFAH